MVRCHGRHTETWDAKGIPVVERFRYLYDADALGEWVPRICKAAGRIKLAPLMNNYANYGTTKARDLRRCLLRAEGPFA